MALRKIVKLPQFLNEVDNQTKNMSHEQLEKFIHEIARILPENNRENFLATMESFKVEASVFFIN